MGLNNIKGSGLCPCVLGVLLKKRFGDQGPYTVRALLGYVGVHLLGVRPTTFGKMEVAPRSLGGLDLHVNLCH